MHKAILLVTLAVAFCPSVLAQPTATLIAAETTQEMLAAQIRLQGFTCDKPLGAAKDTKRSRPDLGVWVLKCSNATYRIKRAPDLAAKVEPLPRAITGPDNRIASERPNDEECIDGLRDLRIRYRIGVVDRSVSGRSVVAR